MMKQKCKENIPDWYDVYEKQIAKSGGDVQYMKFKINHKKKLLKILRKNCDKGKIIEVGCGTGIITAEMAHEGYNSYGLDINERILDLAKKLEFEYFGENKAEFLNQSLFELNFSKDYFELCYSVGVMEHFEDEQIIDSLKKQFKIAKKTIIVIPTKWFDDSEMLHGDDRFLEIKKWRQLISQSNGTIIKEYSYPFKQRYYQKIKNIRKIFRPQAYRVFLIEENRNV